MSAAVLPEIASARAHHLIDGFASRRITVVIHWDERGRDHSFDVVQWVTKPQIGAGAASGPEDLTGLGTAAAKPGTTGPAR